MSSFVFSQEVNTKLFPFHNCGNMYRAKHTKRRIFHLFDVYVTSGERKELKLVGSGV